ncbi:MAG: MotA/TolQ/ExbB proton channel family protein [Verrucomicrobia bacterium]|nr:MotA/TolQ/ExbB proton channel family protein [Verrucomicrobiota bacterium]MCH8527539.1 MotA/TolQ/ExbB proton channel family protein [Kiritimatiellia bacterium]
MIHSHLMILANVTVDVDWFEQLAKGGLIVLVQGLLVIALVAIMIERLMTLRKKRFAPDGLLNAAFKACDEGQSQKILRYCADNPSLLGDAVKLVTENPTAPSAELSEDIRELAQTGIEVEYEKLGGLSLIASIAPLLGLLGTMIGMIESFQLVALFGDEGGASLLADSIAKALITTAVGLMIAVPALFLHHLFKRKIQSLTRVLESELGRLNRRWLRDVIVEPAAPAPASSAASPAAAPATRG